MLNSFFTRGSLLALIVSNLALLAIALYYKLPLFDILLIYWSETVTISFFTFLKMVIVQFYKPARINNSEINSNEAKIAGAVNVFSIFIKLFLIVIFTVMMYVMSLLQLALIVGLFGTEAMRQSIEFPVQEFSTFITGMSIIFFSHAVSFIFNFIRKKEYTFLKARRIIWIPFRRILILTIVIISGALILLQIKSDSIYALIPYFLIKLLFDIYIDSVERKKNVVKGN